MEQKVYGEIQRQDKDALEGVMMKSLLFTNVKVIMLTGIHDYEVLVEDGKITRVENRIDRSNLDIEIIDGGGNYLAPGFIELHSHGAGGYDFMDGNHDATYKAIRAHLRYGTTSICPTSITSTKESLLKLVKDFNELELSREGHPNILGLHLEGPYFAYNQRGAQDPKYLRNPDPAEYLEVLESTDRIIRWSFAAELEGSKEFLSILRDKGIVTSVAHSDATTQEVIDAYENGVSILTHFYSGMSTVTRRNAYRFGGVIEAGYLIDDLYVEVIADGKHLPKELLQLIYKIKGADRICLITDSMRAAGMPDGKYILGNLETGNEVIVEDGVAKLLDRSAFAGSVATADRLIRTFREFTGAPLYEVIKLMTFNPAKVLGISDRKGSIAAGKDADLILFNENIEIEKVILRGETVNFDQ